MMFTTETHKHQNHHLELLIKIQIRLPVIITRLQSYLKLTIVFEFENHYFFSCGHRSIGVSMGLDGDIGFVNDRLKIKIDCVCDDGML